MRPSLLLLRLRRDFRPRNRRWDNQTAAQLPVTTVDFTRTGGSLSSRNRIKLDDFNGRNRDG